MNENLPHEPAPTEPPPVEPPPPRRKTRTRLVVMLLLAVMVIGGFGFRNTLRSTRLGEWLMGPNNQTSVKKAVYRCPMHHQYTSDKPGECPICSMTLVKDEPSQEKTAGERKILYWVDPMNPAHKSNQPGKAPDGMDLIPVYADGESQVQLPPGSVRITPEKQQLIGVTYGEVSLTPLAQTIRAVGKITYDETKITRIHTKIEGWIEKVYVDYTGKFVTKGQPLFDIYSPDLLATQEEYLLALKARKLLSGSSYPEISSGSKSLYEASRKRLLLWDIPEQEIRKIEATGEPTKTVTVYVPNSGFILTKNAFERQKVTPDTDLYTVVDLSTVWVVADIYEFEASQIKPGQTATMTLSYFPEEQFQGKVTYLYPQLDPTTRTLKVRLEIPNPTFKLKPEMFVNVDLKVDHGRQLSVPEEAILDSGLEQRVFVAHEGGYFEPRKVQVGAKVGNRYVILEGLQAGEKIVTSGNFLIDSESRLKSALDGMGSPNQPGRKEMPEGKKTTDHSQMPGMDHSQPQTIPKEEDKR